jgi:sterol 3beta-glucosyltransferase
MARVVIMTIGSYGDVVPYVGLGERLRAVGHDVRIAANESSAELVTAAGLNFHGLPGPDLRAVAATAEGEAAGRAGLRGTASLIRTAADAMRRPIPAMIEAADGQDVILCTPATVLLVAPIAEARGVPCGVLALQPIIPTRAFGPIALGGRNFGAWLNKVSAELLGRMAVRAFAGTVRTLRAEIGLGYAPTPGRGPADLAVVHGISPAILPRPADYGPNAEFAGCWWPPASVWTPPPALERFLADGPAPVYIGFGSAGATQGPRLSAIVSDALGRSGHRAVVQRGWADLAVSVPDVIVVDHVPHDWLFPRVAAVVHHCGAGTTAAGLRHGRPAVPVPFSQDQPFWANRLVALGAAPRVIPAKGLRADRLADALTEATTNASFTDAAAVVAAELAREDGAAAVLRLVHQLVPDQDDGAQRRPAQ